jgi:hypothetical protein
MRPTGSAPSVFAVAMMALTGCFHDFDAFDPVASADGSVANVGVDGGDDSASPGTPDANGTHTPPADGSPATTADASSCGVDCRTEATSCAGVCAEVEQSCEAACDGGSCATCASQQSSCISNCVTSCETCTSNENCLDPAGCTAAAP